MASKNIGYYTATSQIMNRDMFEYLYECNKVFAIALLNKFVEYLKDEEEDEVSRQSIFFTFLQVYQDASEITTVIESIKDDKCSILYLPMYYEHLCKINNKLINKELEKHDCTHLVPSMETEEDDQDIPSITIALSYIPKKDI